MISKLKKEIAEMERDLQKKKDDLNKLVEANIFESKKLIVIAELRDQFVGITDVLLIDDTEVAIKAIEEQHESFCYHHELKFFRISQLKKLKEDFKYLKEMLALEHYGQNSLYEWMETNNDKLIEV